MYKRKIRALIGCEESGVVREAMRARGIDAMSCDLKPTRKKGPHYQGSIFDVLDYPWDLVILHPPCTHTSVSGSRHFAAKWEDGRQAAGISFIMSLVRRTKHVPHFCLEQPISIVSSLWKKPTQVIQPYQFGHPESKGTCLWLRGLPKLQCTNNVYEHMMTLPINVRNRIHYAAPGEKRAEERSETFRGIAEAMADQWLRYLTEPDEFGQRKFEKPEVDEFGM